MKIFLKVGDRSFEVLLSDMKKLEHTSLLYRKCDVFEKENPVPFDRFSISYSPESCPRYLPWMHDFFSCLEPFKVKVRQAIADELNK